MILTITRPNKFIQDVFARTCRQLHWPGARLAAPLLCAATAIIFLSGAVVAADPATTAQGVTLEDISASSLPGNRVQIKLVMSGPAAQPLSFTIDNPARIALDFPSTSVSLPKNNQAVGLGMVTSVNAVEAKGRARVVLNLIQLVPYETRIEGNNVYLTLDGAGGSGATSVAANDANVGSALSRGLRQVAQSSGADALSNIDFRRGEKGEARVVVSLSNPGTSVDIHEEGGQIVVDFAKTTLPERLERRLDVADFATPVRTVDTSTKGDNVRMIITSVGEYEHLAYQSGSIFTIEVKPLTKQELAQAKKDKQAYTGDKLSLNFQDIEVRSVLQLIADFTGLNIVTSDSVQGNLTLRLKNVPWDQALDIILQSKGLTMRQTGNVLQIAPTEEVAAREKIELESQKQVAELAPLRSELVRINYAKASDLATLLKAKENSLLSARGNVTIDDRTNTLLIQDTADKLAEIRQLITMLDIAQRQVQIESRIVVANNDFSKNLGVRFGVNGVEDTSGGVSTIGGSSSATNGVMNDAAENLATTGSPFPVGIPSLADRLNVNLPIASSNAGRIALGILGAGFLLDLELSALQAEGRGEVISNPRVITSNQKEALIEQGTEIPYLEASSSGAATISFKKAVLSLKVTPQITPDDRIIMDLTVTQDTVGQTILLAGSAVPSIDTREVTTQVLVNNGETVVLGGVYEAETRNDSDRVPFFGDLPYVGALFRQTRQTENKSELLIFVTPKIVNETLSLGN
ncbi:MAG: type IV pilus secretin PilQ [Gammaproteobacteria bacterium]